MDCRPLFWRPYRPVGTYTRPESACLGVNAIGGIGFTRSNNTGGGANSPSDFTLTAILAPEPSSCDLRFGDVRFVQVEDSITFAGTVFLLTEFSEGDPLYLNSDDTIVFVSGRVGRGSWFQDPASRRRRPQKPCGDGASVLSAIVVARPTAVYIA